MSQFIVQGNGCCCNSTNISNIIQDNYLLFSKNNEVSGIQPPLTNNNILQWNASTQTYEWNELNLSTITGNKEATEGILWTDCCNRVHTMSDIDGVYQITISNHKYTLTPLEETEIKFDPSVDFDSLLIKGWGNNISGISPPSTSAYLHYDPVIGYTFTENLQTVSSPGIVYWNGSNYKPVYGLYGEGVYGFSKSGSSMTNLTSANGFLVASNRKMTQLNYPAFHGDYVLSEDRYGNLNWKRVKTIEAEDPGAEEVIDVSFPDKIVTDESIMTIPYAGNYILSLNFTAHVNVIDLPKTQENFQAFLDVCPKITFRTSDGTFLFDKIFTGPMNYEYFSYTLFKRFALNDEIIPVWENNDNSAVEIIDTSGVLTYVEAQAQNKKYEAFEGDTVSDTESIVVGTASTTGRYIVITNIDYIITDLINVPDDSKIIMKYGKKSTANIYAIPPVIFNIYSNTSVYVLEEGDEITLTVNNPYVKITNYNIILNKIN